MSGGNLLAYSALTTKIRAMTCNLLTAKDYETLSQCRNVTEAFAYLQKLPGFEELFANIDPSTVHRGQIEWLLNFSTYKDFTKIYCFAQKRQRSYLNLYFMQYEINNLKRYLRAILDPRQSTYVSIVENDFERHSKINTQKISQCTNVDEFIEALSGTIYHKVMLKVHTLGNPSLFDYEMALDLFFFTTLWSKKDSLFKGKDRKYITESYGTRIDLLNLLWIYRCKRYYYVPNAAIYTFLIPAYHKVKKSEIRTLVETTSVEDLISKILNTHYGKYFNFHDGIPFEEECNQVIERIIYKDFKENPYSLAAINGYFHMKNTQTAKLITALECIRYDYPPERILQYVNRKGSGA